MRGTSQDPTGIMKHYGILWKRQTGKGMWSSSSCTGATQDWYSNKDAVCYLTYGKTPKDRQTLVRQSKNKTWSHGHGDLLPSFEPSYTWSKFDGTRRSVRLTRLCKLTKPQNHLVIHVQTLLCPLPTSVGHARIAARDQWSSVQMPSHRLSPSLCAEESVVLIRIQTHITGTVRRNVNVPMCMCECVNVCVIQGVIHCTSSGTSFSSPDSAIPISSLIGTLSLQRTHTREKN